MKKYFLLTLLLTPETCWCMIPKKKQMLVFIEGKTPKKKNITQLQEKLEGRIHIQKPDTGVRSKNVDTAGTCTFREYGIACAFILFIEQLLFQQH